MKDYMAEWKKNSIRIGAPMLLYIGAPGLSTKFLENFVPIVTVQPCIFLPACSGQEALGVCLMKI